MRNEVKILVGLVAVSVLLVVGAALLLGRTNTPTSSSQTKADPKLLTNASSHMLGGKTSKVQLVEFGDFECPACYAAYPEVKKVTDFYKDKIQFVFRNFPLDQHKNAIIGAAAAEAAGKQGKYWEMHDMLYQNQSAWSHGEDPSKDDAKAAQLLFNQFAKQLSLDVAEFDKDMQSSDVKDTITKDQNNGISLGINSTPSFYLDGIAYPKVMSFDQMKLLIDAELAKK